MRELFRDKKDLFWLNKAVPEAKKYVLALTFVRTFLGITGVCYAMCLRNIVNNAIAGVHKEVMKSVIVFAVLIIMQFLFLLGSRFLDEYARATVENRLKSRLFESLLYRDYGQVTNVHSGEWMNRMTSDTVVVADAVTNIIPTAAGMIARLISSAGMLLILMPEFTLILMIGGAAISLSTLWLRKLMKRLHRQIQEKDGKLRVFLTERLGSLMVIKAYQQEEHTHSQAEHLMDEHKDVRMKRCGFSTLCSSGLVFAMNASIVLGAAYCGFGILKGTVDYGTFTAVVQLIGQLQSPMAGITGFIPQYYAMLASVERLMEAEEFHLDERKASVKTENDFEAFGLRQVSYAYPGNDEERQSVLTDMTMQVNKGEYTAFAGPSGCGKSTVLKLLLGLYEPDKGLIYISDQNGERKLTKEWTSLFAYVPQGNHLMNGTIREVVSFARPDKADDTEKIYKALKGACAEEFVNAMPKGIDTELGERGCGLSEGQMQRIAVARALFSERPVLLLDEATSALDSESEVMLLKNIRELTGKTVIIVTHRPAALTIVDKVINFS